MAATGRTHSLQEEGVLSDGSGAVLRIQGRSERPCPRRKTETDARKVKEGQTELAHWVEVAEGPDRVQVIIQQGSRDVVSQELGWGQEERHILPVFMAKPGRQTCEEL